MLLVGEVAEIIDKCPEATLEITRSDDEKDEKVYGLLVRNNCASARYGKSFQRLHKVNGLSRRSNYYVLCLLYLGLWEA